MVFQLTVSPAMGSSQILLSLLCEQFEDIQVMLSYSRGKYSRCRLVSRGILSTSNMVLEPWHHILSFPSVVFGYYSIPCMDYKIPAHCATVYRIPVRQDTKRLHRNVIRCQTRSLGYKSIALCVSTLNISTAFTLAWGFSRRSIVVFSMTTLG